MEPNSPEAEPNFEKKKSSPLCWVLPLLLSSFVAYLFTFFILSSMGSSIHSHLKALPPSSPSLPSSLTSPLSASASSSPPSSPPSSSRPICLPSLLSSSPRSPSFPNGPPRPSSLSYHLRPPHRLLPQRAPQNAGRDGCQSEKIVDGLSGSDRGRRILHAKPSKIEVKLDVKDELQQSKP